MNKIIFMFKKIKTFYRLIFIFSLIGLSSSVSAGLKTMSSVQGMELKPLSLQSKQNSYSKNTIVLPKPTIPAAKDHSLHKVLKFASPYDSHFSLSNSGDWSQVGNTAIWKIIIDSADTLSLNLGLSNVFIPPEANLFIYSYDLSQMVIYTEADNKSHGELWTPVYDTSKLVIELNVPIAFIDNASLTVSKVNQGYISIHDAYKSGSCNIDVVCPMGEEWRNEISSVVRLLIDGIGLCTGNLVNNTNEDNTPYILTADHCGITALNDSSVVFYWNYETSICGGTPDGSLSFFNSGSILRASYDDQTGSDFTLIEMLDAPPSGAIYAGWDYRNIAPANAVGIHHPSGDEKRISFENDTLLITDYLSNITNSNEKYLRVAAWDFGTTEGGSSGSAIWNSDHQIVGTLSGGYAACASSTDDNNLPDWYGRFSSHWTGGGTSSTRLSNWLDPTSSSTGTMSPSVANCNRPSGEFSISVNPVNVSETVNFSSTISGGSTSVYNYEWDFNSDGVIDSTEANPSYIYSTNYQGPVTLNVSDSGCTKSIVKAIIVESTSSGGGSGSGNSSSNSGGSGSIGFIFIILSLFSLKRILFIFYRKNHYA